MSTLILDRREFLKAGTVAGTGLLIGLHLSAAAKDPAEEQEKKLPILSTRGCTFRRTTA
jgi:hypothetical protein